MHPSSRLPPAVLGLLGAMVLGYVGEIFLWRASIFYLGLIPAAVIKNGWLWQLVTYLFLHGSVTHLLFNGLTLYWFAPAICDRWGDRKFLVYYFVCGIAAAVLVLATDPMGVAPTIGASGALYGLMFAYAKFYPDSIVYFYGLFPMRMKHLIILLGVMEFLLSQTPSPIARFAHLGGLLMGWLFFRLDLWSLADWLRKKRSMRTIERQEEESEFQEKEINRILEKISARGMNSLTPWERKILERASRNE
ncbi:MAG: rhomboid family intramembrane serine protease [Elusimicrobia bacterium]|nr:rhomboid family intramembrane serine protease [Elusimicrobiota bacterium]